MQKKKKNILSGRINKSIQFMKNYLKLDMLLLLKILIVEIFFILFDYYNDSHINGIYIWPFAIGIFVFQNLSNMFKLFYYRKNGIDAKIVPLRKSVFTFDKSVEINNNSVSHVLYWHVQVMPYTVTFFITIIAILLIMLNSIEGLTIIAIDTNNFLNWTWIICAINSIIFLAEITFKAIKLKLIKKAITGFPLDFDEKGKYINKYKGTFKNNHKLISLFEKEYENYLINDLKRELIYLNSMENSFFNEPLKKIVISIMVAISTINVPILMDELRGNINLPAENTFGKALLSYAILIFIVLSINFVVLLFLDNANGESKKNIFVKKEIVKNLICKIESENRSLKL